MRPLTLFLVYVPLVVSFPFDVKNPFKTLTKLYDRVVVKSNPIDKLVEEVTKFEVPELKEAVKTVTDKILKNDQDTTQDTTKEEVVDVAVVSALKDTTKYGWLASAIRCENQKLLDWSCRMCVRVPSFKLKAIVEDKTLKSRGMVVVDEMNKEVVVSFRSTNSEVNWIQNLLLAQFPFNSYLDTNQSQYRDIKVHSGFLNLFKSLLNPIYSTFDTFLPETLTSYRFVFVGHSLGGALATLFLTHLQHKYNLPISNTKLITYGQPKVGNSDFVNYIHSKNFEVIRAVNFKDPVPHLPPQLFNYYHFDKELFQNEHNNFKLCTSTTPGCSRNQIPETTTDTHQKFNDVSFIEPC